MTPQTRVIETARAEIGYLEKATNYQLNDKTANAGYNNWNKFAAFLDDLGVVYNGKKNGYSWCDCFVDYCFIYTLGLELGMAMTFQPKKGEGAGCTYSMRYYKKAFSRTRNRATRFSSRMIRAQAPIIRVLWRRWRAAESTRLRATPQAHLASSRTVEPYETRVTS